MASLLFIMPLASAVSTDVLQALNDGRDLVVGRAAMRVLPSRLITNDGGICDTETCWVGKNTRESLDLRAEGERQKKVSKDSYAAALVSGATQHTKFKGSSGDLIDERILRVIRLLVPDAYFFAAERATRYEVIAAPSILAPHTLPAGERGEQLVIVWRRVGLEFLLHRIDLDLCPSWDACALGSPKLSGIEAAAFDAARAKPLGAAALAALNAARLPPAAPAAQAAAVQAAAAGGGGFGVTFERSQSQCRPDDISDTRAAFAASPFPVFPASEDWVLAASSRFRIPNDWGGDGTWTCLTPYRGKRCWRDEKAALAAVARAEEQNPGYTLAQRALVAEDYTDERMPAASKDIDDSGELSWGPNHFNYPIPGEKPYVPDPDRTYTHGDKRISSLAPLQYIRYPSLMHVGELELGCARCLDWQAEHCESCEEWLDTRVDECSDCERYAEWPEVAARSQTLRRGAQQVWKQLQCETCPRTEADVNELVRSVSEECRSKALRECRMSGDCVTWSGNMDPK